MRLRQQQQQKQQQTKQQHQHALVRLLAAPAASHLRCNPLPAPRQVQRGMASTSGAPPLPATATDARKAFVVDAIAAAISPPKFKVCASPRALVATCGCCAVCVKTKHVTPDASCAVLHTQAAYADALARDDGGAIAAFLDSPVVQLLQVSVAHATTGLPKLRLTNTPDFPPGCSQQVNVERPYCVS